MNRTYVPLRATALVLLACLGAQVQAASVSLTVDVTFNTPGDIHSGGTWITVAKADESGLAGISYNFVVATVNFDPVTGFDVKPPSFDVAVSAIFSGTFRQIVEGDDLFPAPVLGVGLGGGPYVDPPSVMIAPGNSNLGSFTGAATLARGTFNSGVIPTWHGTGTGRADANVFNSAGQAIQASVQTTVRYVNIPEPATIVLLGIGGCAAIVLRRMSCPAT
ncbi:MAG: PEP-CTERM sorting domain-containing protein [Pirellulales bacterium]|nr:PEP-CTERM sorting domain-containing protein [Pirellulales bacterium]